MCRFSTALLALALSLPTCAIPARADSTDDTTDEDGNPYINWYKYFSPDYVFDSVEQEGSQIYDVDEGGQDWSAVVPDHTDTIGARTQPSAAPQSGAMMAGIVGQGGDADVTLFDRGDGSFNVSIDIWPPAETGRLVTLQGVLVVCVYRVSDLKLVLAYPKPIYGIFFPPRSGFYWTSPPIRGLPPGHYVTASFAGYGLATNAFYIVPGVFDVMMMD